MGSKLVRQIPIVNYFIVFAMFVAAAVAAPANPDAAAVIVRLESDNIGVGRYNYAAETSNGINIQESGQLADVGTDDEGIVVRGKFSYVGLDGVLYSVSYVADKNGFQPSGAHLPQAPGIATT